METMPEEINFAVSIATLGSILLLIEADKNLPVIFILNGGLWVIASSLVRIIGAYLRNNPIKKLYSEKDSFGRLEKVISHLLLPLGIILFLFEIYSHFAIL